MPSKKKVAALAGRRKVIGKETDKEELFKKMTELGIWQGHTANIMQELSEPDLEAFLEAAREHRLADGPYHVEMPTTAFTAAPRIVSNHN